MTSDYLTAMINFKEKKKKKKNLILFNAINEKYILKQLGKVVKSFSYNKYLSINFDLAILTINTISGIRTKKNHKSWIRIKINSFLNNLKSLKILCPKTCCTKIFLIYFTL